MFKLKLLFFLLLFFKMFTSTLLAEIPQRSCRKGHNGCTLSKESLRAALSELGLDMQDSKPVPKVPEDKDSPTDSTPGSYLHPEDTSDTQED